jgi:hypothetical protein
VSDVGNKAVMEVAEYLEGIFLHDWMNLAQAKVLM